MLIQLLTDDKRESVLEFSARTGGGAKYLLLKKMAGFDPITSVIEAGEQVLVRIQRPDGYSFVGCAVAGAVDGRGGIVFFTNGKALVIPVAISCRYPVFVNFGIGNLKISAFC